MPSLHDETAPQDEPERLFRKSNEQNTNSEEPPTSADSRQTQNSSQETQRKTKPATSAVQDVPTWAFYEILERFSRNLNHTSATADNNTATNNNSPPSNQNWRDSLNYAPLGSLLDVLFSQFANDYLDTPISGGNRTLSCSKPHAQRLFNKPVISLQRVPGLPLVWKGEFIPVKNNSQDCIPLSVGQCYTCEKLYDWIGQGPSRQKNISLFHDLKDFFTCFMLGCGLCGRLWFEFSRHGLWNQETPWKRHLFDHLMEPERCKGTPKVIGNATFPALTVSVVLGKACGDGASEIDIRKFHLTHLELPVAEEKRGIRKPRVLSMHTATNKNINVARAWIKRCIVEHVNCRPKITLVTHPKRLIEIQYATADSISSHFVARLVHLGENTDDPEHGSCAYVCLSYCWGGKSTLMLTQRNEETLKSGIKVEALPQTIRDAIEVTMLCGYRYLWVDSLCIVQDSEEEWLRESAKMASIYEGADFTIAALGASSSEDGLFSVRDPVQVGLLRTFPPLAVKNSQPFIAQYIDDAPLHARAWVAQERAFSRRTLNFGPFLSWECRTCSESESNVSIGTYYNLKYLFQALHNNLTSLTRISLPQSGAVIRRLCKGFLEPYLRAALTRPSDRLKAIEGIIGYIRTKTNWRNRFGLWEPFFIEQLTWMREWDASAERQVLGRLEMFPSWSWACIGESANLKFKIWDAEMLSSQTSPVARLIKSYTSILAPTDNNIGPGAQICIEAHLFPLFIENCDSWKISFPAVVRIEADCIGSIGPELDQTSSLSFDIQSIFRDGLHFAPLVQVECSTENGSRYKYFGLVLRRFQRDNMFERVGGGEISLTKSISACTCRMMKRIVLK